MPGANDHDLSFYTEHAMNLRCLSLVLELEAQSLQDARGGPSVTYLAQKVAELRAGLDAWYTQLSRAGLLAWLLLGLCACPLEGGMPPCLMTLAAPWLLGSD